MSREKILVAVRKHRPARKKELPEIPRFTKRSEKLFSDFKTMVSTGGGNLIELGAGEHLADVLRTVFPKAEKVLSASHQFAGNVDWKDYSEPTMLNTIDLAVIEGEIGVSENGAVWVSESRLGHRVLPFITQHLALLLPRRQLVNNMSEAYQRIKIDQDGFGVFIAGPSKTADIEQSLVIGAQGARSFTVIIT
jgi:L-lactate dehydrogenase complex protein LldG